jgi:MYXO-CTERM domain-containing protein
MLRRARLDLGCACDLGGDRDRPVGQLPWLLAAALAAFLGRRRRRHR